MRALSTLLAMFFLFSDVSGQIDWQYSQEGVGPDAFFVFLHGYSIDDTLVVSAYQEDDGEGQQSSLVRLSPDGDFISEQILTDNSPIVYFDPLSKDTVLVAQIVIDSVTEEVGFRWSHLVDDEIIPTNLSLSFGDNGFEVIKFGKVVDSDLYHMGAEIFIDDDFLTVLAVADIDNGTLFVDMSGSYNYVTLAALPDADGYLALSADGIHLLDDGFEETEFIELFNVVAGVRSMGDSLAIFLRDFEGITTTIYTDGNVVPRSYFDVPGFSEVDDGFSEFAICGSDSYLVSGIRGPVINAFSTEGASVVRFGPDLDTVSVTDIYLPDVDMFPYNYTCLDESLIIYGELDDGAKGVVLRLLGDGLVSVDNETIAASDEVVVSSHDVDGRLLVRNHSDRSLKMVIYNAAGVNLGISTLQASDNRIDVGHLPSGTYYAQVMDGRRWITSSTWFKQ